MRFNPPIWNPKAELGMSASTLQGIVIKGSIVLWVVLIFDDGLLKLPAIRRLFGLEVKKCSRYNGSVALVVMIGSMLVWYLFVLFDRVLLVTPFPPIFFQITDPHEAIALVVFLVAGIILSSVLVSYQESRLKSEVSLATNEERLQLAVIESKEAESRIRQSLKEKEILLREVHHRVKNNLQVISSLVSLQESSCSDEEGREMNRDTQVRIQSMASLHEQLYGSKDLSSIDPGEYLNAIVRELTSYHEGFQVRIDAQPDVLTIDEAMPFGLIATELLTNAMKYAYPQGNPGEILVSYGRSGRERRLLVSDEGVGLPPAAVKLTSLGFTLVRSLAAQLGGQLTMRPTAEGETSPGLTVALVFPAPH